jgi:hypothetical protein
VPLERSASAVEQLRIELLGGCAASSHLLQQRNRSVT